MTMQGASSRNLGTPLFDDDVDALPWLLVDLRADVFQDAKDIAHRSVSVLHAHVDDAPVIQFAIEGRVHLYPAFAELLAQIIGKRDVRAASAGAGIPDDRVKLVSLLVSWQGHGSSLLRLFRSNGGPVGSSAHTQCRSGS